MRSLFGIYILLTMFVCAGTVNAQRANYDVIPLPKSVKVDSVKVFNLCKDAGVAFDATNPEVYRNVLFLCEWVKEMTGIELKRRGALICCAVWENGTMIRMEAAVKETAARIIC